MRNVTFRIVCDKSDVNPKLRKYCNLKYTRVDVELGPVKSFGGGGTSLGGSWRLNLSELSSIHWHSPHASKAIIGILMSINNCINFRLGEICNCNSMLLKIVSIMKSHHNSQRMPPLFSHATPWSITWFWTLTPCWSNPIRASLPAPTHGGPSQTTTPQRHQTAY